MLSVEVQGLELAYQRAGQGPPLVLLHGAVSDSRTWRPQMEELSDQFTVVAWDAPGSGRSPDPPEPYGMAEWADSLAAFLETLDLGPAHVLGLSWGGSLATELYHRHPERVASLILADTYAGWKGSLPAEVVAKRLEMALETAAMPPSELAARWLPGLITADASPEVADEITSIMLDSHPAGLRLIAHAMAECDQREILPTVEVPVLLLWGEQDERSPLSVAEAMLELLPNARLALIPGAGHDSNVERPERFSAEVRAFCRSVSA